MRFNRCFGCMEELEAENTVCPHCGFDPAYCEGTEYALRPGTLLQGKYMVGKVLGKGGFGITYIGFDMMLDIKVTIKEYYPEGFVGRDSRQSSRLTWYSTKSDIQYVKNSRENLLKEAGSMTQMDTFPTLARVRQVFMANETVYLVMDYIEGETLKTRVMKNGALTYAELRNYLCPVMADLAQIHEKGIIHRNISPDNIMIEATGKVRLLDLGAAKNLYKPAKTQIYGLGETQNTSQSGSSSGAAQNTMQSDSVPESIRMILKPGFSPLEQYRMHGEIGPWTDVYAMVATIYYLLARKVPPTPMDRLASEEEEKEVQNVINGLDIPEKAKEGMRKGFAILKKDRIGSMRELLEYLPEKPEPVGPWPKPRKKWPFVLLGVAILAGGGYAAMTGLQSTQKKAEQYYEEGNYEEALTAYREDGDTENVERVLQAMYDLAEDYRTGSDGYEKNEEEAIRYYRLVAEDESAGDDMLEKACFELGWIMAKNEIEEDDVEAVSWFEKAIEKGNNGNANNWLGWMYENGKGVPQNYEKAVELYKKAADAESGYAQNKLGWIYENGEYGQKKDLEEALKWYKEAAENDYDGAQESVARVEQALQEETETERSTEKTAEQYYEEGNYEEALTAYREAGDTENVERVLQTMYDLAWNYKDGKNGVEKNEEEAIRYFKLVAEDESAGNEMIQNACHRLGHFMSDNEAEEDDLEAAFWFEKAIEKGSVKAITDLGGMYRTGKGVTQDYEKAIELYKQAADAGEDYAMNHLGRIYENGDCGQEKNLEEALKWYKLAAEKNHDGAQESVERVLQSIYDLAGNYKDGKNGVEKNEEEAVRYYKLVAEDESAGDDMVKNACALLGWLMAANEDEKDDTESVSWYEKAMEKGNVAAINNLGWMYECGQGVQQDYEKAMELYKQAADAGYNYAMNNLGRIYEYGNCGQKINLEEALKWYKQAVEYGYDNAQESVTRVEQAIHDLTGNSSAGESGTEKNEGDATEETAESFIAPEGTHYRAALLLTGNLGDKSLFDSANEGLTRLRDELGPDVFDFKVEEMGGTAADECKWEPTLLGYCDSGEYDVIIMGTWQMAAPLATASVEYPDQKFILFDEQYDFEGNGNLDNIYNVLYRQNEVSYLVGAAAAMMTTDADLEGIDPDNHVIGFLGAMDNNVINDCLVGYIQGASDIDPDIEVAVGFVGDFIDSTKGKDIAISQYQSGADVGFNVAGNAGLGQIEAAKDEGKYAFGVDSDQAALLIDYADCIPTSAVKNVGQSLDLALQKDMLGELAYGTTETYGVKEGGVTLVKDAHYEEMLPESIRTKLDELEQSIINGDIVVKSSYDMEQAEIDELKASVEVGR